MADNSKKLSRWYFGGLSSAGAACITHPLDLLKVHLQTQQEGKISVVRSTAVIVQKQGVLALYNGLSASLLRQLTYSTTRFGAYEVGKQTLETNGPLPFYKKLLLAGFSGAVGGVIGTPGDVINVRMQNDIKLPQELRRNYKHALDGVVRVLQQEGFRQLFSGCTTATLRAALMTIGQLSFYDQIKLTLLESGYFEDNPATHVLSSVAAGAIATTLTQPLDVLKTRAMNAKPGEFKEKPRKRVSLVWLPSNNSLKLTMRYNASGTSTADALRISTSLFMQGLMDLFFYTAKLGPLAFFKGYAPAFVRLAPHTILTFVFLEQLRSNFGFYPSINGAALKT